MDKINVLHIGIKNYPFDSAFTNKHLKGLRGGGMNKYCNLLIESLPDSIETTIITQQMQGQSRYEFANNVRIYRLRTFGNRAFRQIIANILSFFFACIIIKRHNINIIHGHSQPGILIGYYLGKIFNRKVIGTPYSFTTNAESSLLKKMARFIEDYYYKRIDKVVFETEENMNKAVELRNLRFPNSIIINTGLTLPPRELLQHHINSKLRFFFIGRIVKIKALDNLILSLLHLSEELRNQVKIDILGEGELLDAHLALIKENKLSDFITIHGFVLDPTNFFVNSDVFILPSNMEGLSISLLEAMSYGKACIVNNFGVPFSKDEIFIMKNNNPETIADAIKYFLQHKDLVLKLGKKARERIENDFSVQSFSHKYTNLYKQMI